MITNTHVVGSGAAMGAYGPPCGEGSYVQGGNYGGSYLGHADGVQVGTVQTTGGQFGTGYASGAHVHGSAVNAGGFHAGGVHGGPGHVVVGPGGSIYEPGFGGSGVSPGMGGDSACCNTGGCCGPAVGSGVAV